VRYADDFILGLLAQKLSLEIEDKLQEFLRERAEELEMSKEKT